MVENLRVFIEAARQRGEPLDHVLLFGPPGLGKTTLAYIIAHEMESALRGTSGPVIEMVGDLAAILTNLDDHGVLFIDEIHRMSPSIEEVLDISRGQLFFKVREKKKGTAQYEKVTEGGQGKFHEVSEGPCTFLVNFTDYLDTGLFLDHRLTREMIRDMAAGKRFLNLFGYTGTATVHAAVGGAAATTTVDLSNTYLEWARRNLRLNGFRGDLHALEQADCLQWLAASRRERYGLIFLDPPTFSNSKRMTRDLDLQRDHTKLIAAAARLLTPDGVLLFASNFRKFELQTDELRGLECEDVSRATLPRDFERNPRIHRCWRITRGRGAAV